MQSHIIEYPVFISNCVFFHLRHVLSDAQVTPCRFSARLLANRCSLGTLQETLLSSSMLPTFVECPLAKASCGHLGTGKREPSSPAGADCFKARLCPL